MAAGCMVADGKSKRNLPQSHRDTELKESEKKSKKEKDVTQRTPREEHGGHGEIGSRGEIIFSFFSVAL